MRTNHRAIGRVSLATRSYLKQIHELKTLAVSGAIYLLQAVSPLPRLISDKAINVCVCVYICVCVSVS